MSTTIKEQIISALALKLGDILTTNGYRTNCGADVQKGSYRHAPEDPPMTVIFPRPETVERKYSVNNCTFDLAVEMISPFAQTDDPVTVSESMLADAIVCLTGESGVWDLGFKAGVIEIKEDDEIAGASSGATATVVSVSLLSGTWAGGNAAGTLTLSDLTGTFLDGETIMRGVQSMATTNTISVEITIPDVIGADDIVYSGGGTDRFPEPGESMIGMQATFAIKYKTVAGDPYSQP